MGKLHELLAVEGDLKGEAQRVSSQVKHTFTEGRGRLVGQVRTYQPLDEEGEDFADEVKVRDASVSEELTRFRDAFGRWLDAAVQKETTNQNTSADVEIDGATLIPELPAPALLNLENKLAELRKVYSLIPTNDPTYRWVWDEQLECFVSDPRTSYRTKKTMRSFTAHEATPEHPAQVQTYNEDVRAGTWTTIVQSGALTPKDKRYFLDRIDELVRAVKQARQRANNIEVVVTAVAADAIFDFIHGE